MRSIGLFGIVELVRSRKTRQPKAPFNGSSEDMAALGKFFRESGLYTIVRWNTFYTNPPLCINGPQLREAFAIVDEGLEITDRAAKTSADWAPPLKPIIIHPAVTEGAHRPNPAAADQPPVSRLGVEKRGGLFPIRCNSLHSTRLNSAHEWRWQSLLPVS